MEIKRFDSTLISLKVNYKVNYNKKAINVVIFRSSRPEVFCKKDVLRNLAKVTGKHLCLSFFFNKVAGPSNFMKKETLAQVFSSEFCEISKNSFCYRTSPVAASGAWKITVIFHFQPFLLVLFHVYMLWQI